MDPADLTGQYNTDVAPFLDSAFLAWAKANGRLDDLRDYDLRGAWKAGIAQDPRGHLPDTWKKPNHPTFSNESQYSTPDNPGGQWVDNGNDTWTFNASPADLKYRTADALRNYFQRVEPEATLNLPAPYAARDLAAMGRGNDTVLAHMTPGEVAIPPELIQQRPDLQAMIAKVFAEEGIDPQDYVISNKGTNPSTGLPEYGFFKSLKKIFKNPVVKIAATIAGGALGDYAGVGGATGAALAGGLADYAGGDSVGGALGTAAGTWLGGTYGDKLLGTTGTVGDYIGNGLGSSIANAGIGSVIGAGIGGIAGGMLGQTIDPPKSSGVNLGTSAAAYPDRQTSGSTTPAAVDANSVVNPTPSSQQTPYNSGVTYYAPLKDRNTGQISLKPVSTNLSSSPLANQGWGNVIMV